MQELTIRLAFENDEDLRPGLQAFLLLVVQETLRATYDGSAASGLISVSDSLRTLP